jgi:hypothetical protein
MLNNEAKINECMEQASHVTKSVRFFDEFHRFGLKNYTWSTQNPTITWSRLDRFYVNPSIQLQGGRHKIWPTMGHVIDCAHVFLQIYIKKFFKANHVPFNPLHIHDENTKQ